MRKCNAFIFEKQAIHVVQLIFLLTFWINLHLPAQVPDDFDQIVFIIERDAPAPEPYLVIAKSVKEVVEFKPFVDYPRYIESLPQSIKEISPNFSGLLILHFIDQPVSEKQEFEAFADLQRKLTAGPRLDANPNTTPLIEYFNYYSKSNRSTYFVLLFKQLFLEFQLGLAPAGKVNLPPMSNVGGKVIFKELIGNGKDYQLALQNYQSLLDTYHLDAILLPRSSQDSETVLDLSFKFESVEDMFNRLQNNNSFALSYEKDGKIVYEKILTINGQSLGFFTITPPGIQGEKQRFYIQYRPMDTEDDQEIGEKLSDTLTIRFDFEDAKGNSRDIERFIDFNSATKETIHQWKIDTTRCIPIYNIFSNYQLELNSPQTFAIPIEILEKNKFYDLKLQLQKVDLQKATGPDTTVFSDNTFTIYQVEDRSAFGILLAEYLKELLFTLLSGTSLGGVIVHIRRSKSNGSTAPLAFLRKFLVRNKVS